MSNSQRCMILKSATLPAQPTVCSSCGRVCHTQQQTLCHGASLLKQSVHRTVGMMKTLLLNIRSDSGMAILHYC